MENQSVTSSILTSAIAFALLTDHYQAWAKAEGLPEFSADELAGQVELSAGQLAFIDRFTIAWECAGDLQRREDERTKAARDDSRAATEELIGCMGIDALIAGLAASEPSTQAGPAPTGRVITTAHTVTDEFLGDILCSAFEGGTGYWARLEDIVNGPGEKGVEGQPWYLSARVIDTEWDDNDRDGEPAFQPFVCDLDLVARGIQIILDDHATPEDPQREYATGPKTAHYVRQAVAQNDAGNVDADVADCIVQMGAFGKLVFG